MAFMLLITGWAMIHNLWGFQAKGNWLLLLMGGVIFILEIWLVLVAYLVFRKKARRRRGSLGLEKEI